MAEIGKTAAGPADRAPRKKRFESGSVLFHPKGKKYYMLKEAPMPGFNVLYGAVCLNTGQSLALDAHKIDYCEYIGNMKDIDNDKIETIKLLYARKIVD